MLRMVSESLADRSGQSLWLSKFPPFARISILCTLIFQRLKNLTVFLPNRFLNFFNLFPGFLSSRFPVFNIFIMLQHVRHSQCESEEPNHSITVQCTQQICHCLKYHTNLWAQETRWILSVLVLVLNTKPDWSSCWNGDHLPHFRTDVMLVWAINLRRSLSKNSYDCSIRLNKLDIVVEIDSTWVQKTLEVKINK